jgi:hypothetical protein
VKCPGHSPVPASFSSVGMMPQVSYSQSASPGEMEGSITDFSPLCVAMINLQFPRLQTMALPEGRIEMYTGR